MDNNYFTFVILFYRNSISTKKKKKSNEIKKKESKIKNEKKDENLDPNDRKKDWIHQFLSTTSYTHTHTHLHDGIQFDHDKQ